MSKKQLESRVEALEKRSGGDVKFIVIWDDDDTVTVDGVKMSRSEFDKLYPESIRLMWDDDDVTIIKVEYEDE